MIKSVDVSRFRENVMHAIDCLEMSVSLKSRSLPGQWVERISPNMIRNKIGEKVWRELWAESPICYTRAGIFFDIRFKFYKIYLLPMSWPVPGSEIVGFAKLRKRHRALFQNHALTFSRAFHLRVIPTI